MFISFLTILFLVTVIASLVKEIFIDVITGNIRFDQIYLEGLTNRQFIYSPVLLFLIVLLPLTWMNWYQEFTISKEGIEFQVFIFWKKFVPWESIQEIKKTGIFSKRYIVVILAELTPFHRFLGLTNGFTIKPVFVILPQLQNHKEAISIIENKLSTNHQQA